MKRDRRNPWRAVGVGEISPVCSRWVQLDRIDPDGTCHFWVRGTDHNNRPAAVRPGGSLDCRDTHLLPVRVEVGAAYPAGQWGWAAVKIEELT